MNVCHSCGCNPHIPSCPYKEYLLPATVVKWRIIWPSAENPVDSVIRSRHGISPGDAVKREYGKPDTVDYLGEGVWLVRGQNTHYFVTQQVNEQ